MRIVADVLVGLVALIHVYIVVLEMFLWTTPRARAAFGTTPEFAEEIARRWPRTRGCTTVSWRSRSCGAWSEAGRFQLQLYGLVCVIVAGLYGAATANKRILFVQVLPGALALIALLLAR